MVACPNDDTTVRWQFSRAVGAASGQTIEQREAIASRRRASPDEKRILMTSRLRHFAPDGREFPRTHVASSEQEGSVRN